MPETFLRPIESYEPGDHACLLHDSDERRREAIEAYLLRGVASGDRVLFLAEDDDDLELGRRVHGRAAPGQVEIVAAADAYADDGFDPDRTLAWFAMAKRQALDDGFRALRAAGGVPDEACGDTYAIVSYERRCASLFADGRMVALCGYDRSALGEAGILGVLDVHALATYAVPADDRLSIEAAGGALRLSGWVDAANAGTLARPLQDAIDGEGAVTVDLADVSFADVTAVRVFAEAAHELALRGRRLRLVSPPATLPRLLDILGWADLQGLELA